MRRFDSAPDHWQNLFMENPTAQTPAAPQPPQLSSHTLFELRQLMQWYETKLVADPEHGVSVRRALNFQRELLCNR